MAIDLTDKVCLITGADEGIGFGTSRGFLRRGAKVAMGLLNAEKSSARTAPAFAVQMDVTKPGEVSTAVDRVIERFGRIDVLINNAGIYPRCSADQLSFDDYAKVREVNLDGTWRCCMAVVPHFKKQGGGVIINTGSITLRMGMPQLAHYQSTKGGVLGLTRGLARDLGPYGIRVNCLHLGAVQTEGEARLDAESAKALAAVESKQCLRGRLTPETVEPNFAFLASDESRDITGQSITVDRGWMHD
ncbi:MAG: beta-ketoacyl-ACP reductase [Synoicihabitans sp.]